MFRVVSGTLSASASGTADFTASGLGTIAGALVFINAANATNNPENNPGTSFFSTGFFDGTSQVSAAHHTEDALTGAVNTDCWHMYSNSKVGFWCNNAGTIQAAWTAAAITDGIRITTDTADGAAYQCMVILIPASGVASIDAQVIDCSGITGGAVEVTNVGFEADLVFAMGTRCTANESLGADFVSNLGIVLNDGANTQMSTSLLEDSGRNLSGSTTYLSNIVNNEQAVLINSNGGLVWAAQFTGFDASGWTVNKHNEYIEPSPPSFTASNNADDILALAIKFTGTPNMDLYLATAPTGTGSWAETAPGFTPAFGLVLGGEGVVDITSGDASNAESVSMIAFDASAQRSFGHGSADNVATVQTGDFSLTGWRMVEDGCVPGTNDTFVGTFTSFDANGFTWNFTAVPGTADRWPILTLGAAASGVSVTDVADSDETPGLGTEAWDDGTAGLVASGSGFS